MKRRRENKEEEGMQKGSGRMEKRRNEEEGLTPDGERREESAEGASGPQSVTRHVERKIAS